MLARISAAIIIAFWLVMTALLIRLEVHPESSRVLDVPVSHVVKMMLERGQQSLLTIMENGAPAGTLTLRPVQSAEGGAFDFGGSMSLRLPMGTAQRVSWSGAVELDPALNTRGVHIDLALRSPAYRLMLDRRTAEQTITYEVRDATATLARGALPLDSGQAAAALAGLGVDLTGVMALRKSLGGDAAPIFTAKQAKLPVRSENIEVYQITMRQGGATMADIFISQLGQVLLVKTVFGYTLSAEGLP